MSENSFQHSFKIYLRLLAFAREFRVRIWLTWFFILLSAASTSFVFVQLKPIFDGAFLVTEDPRAQFDHLVSFIIPATLAAALARALSGYGQQYLMGYLGQQVIQKLRYSLYSHFMKLPMAFFNAQRTGNLSTRITNDVQVLQDSIPNVVGTGVSSLVMTLGLSASLIYFEWKMALMALVVFPLALVPIFYFGRKIRRASKERQQLLADLNSQVHETLSGIRVVKAFVMEPFEKARFFKTNRSYFEVSMRSIRALSASSPIVEGMTTLVLLGLVVWLAHASLFPPRTITGGDFVRFFAITATLYPHLKNFNGLWGGVQNAMSCAERCFEILDTHDHMADAAEAVAVAPLKRALEFRGVSFEYLPGRPVLREVSFSVKKGEMVALVGPSGGGKSTLADLIPRFYDPTAGQILWDGVDLRQVKIASLRSHIGIVTQETILFHDSILSNIAYGKPGADFWQVQAAAKAAFAHEFIENTPKGYNTLIGDRGVKLSGGQRQRLAIARAILKNPPVLILDEATSALDTQSEQVVQKALDGLVGQRTTLVIAHRLSTVRKADRILVIDKGRVAEEGRHGALLKKQGLYAKLYKMQFKHK
ncbi:MAG TPA: ABC transporter ATP-binding protein, partial [bacterium]|nr:ABC transporter ATP-binding protein [bacterium]